MFRFGMNVMRKTQMFVYNLLNFKILFVNLIAQAYLVKCKLNIGQ